MMKKISAIILAVLLLCMPMSVYAGESTTYTYTTSVDGSWIRTQDAYLPGGILFQNDGLLQPEDIFYKNGYLYIADSGNRRIGRYRIETGALDWYEIEGLKKPTGIFVDDQERLYIADYGAECVYGAEPDGNVFLKIERPQSYLFSESSRYKPKNVVLSSAGTIYLAGEGSYEGIMQFSPEGEFEGYYAANTTPMSFLEEIEELIFSREQLERLFNRAPRAIYNIDVTDRDLLFSVTQDVDTSLSWATMESSSDNNVKLHNFAGNDIFHEEEMIDEWNFVDVAARADGGCYALTYAGLINEYDLNGNLLFSFGGRAVSSERGGLFSYATAIDCDENGFLYVLDREKGIVQIFYPTEFALTTHDAIALTEAGDYDQAGALWEELLTINGMSRIAHNGYGKTLYFSGKYEEARDHFYLAENKDDYSEVFWEIRDQAINRYGGTALVVLILLYIMWKLGKRLMKKATFPQVTAFERLKEEWRFIRRFMRHPIDSAYDIRANKKLGLAVPTVLYLLLVVIYMWDYLGRGFIFRAVSGTDVSVPVVLAVLLIPLSLWLVGSYLIGTIRDGEGSFRKIYISTAYALCPYLLFGPVVLVSTYVFTQNEAFVFTFFHTVLLTWCVVNLFIATMEVHNYLLKETIINILIILFFIVMAVLACIILYLIWLSVWDYVAQIAGEVKYRVIQ